MTYEPKLTRELGELIFTQPTQQSLNRVRAMNPWPCAYAPVANGVLKVWRSREAHSAALAEPGTILCADPKRGLIIATGDGAMELVEIQAPNAKRMDAGAFLRGHAMETGGKLAEVML